MWGLAVSLAVRQQEMVRRNAYPMESLGMPKRQMPQGGEDRFESRAKFGKKPAEIASPQFFEAKKSDNHKLPLDIFLGAVLQRIHPTLFSFWQRLWNKPQ